MDFLMIQEIFNNTSILWVTIAVVFIIVEISAPGIGGLFSGLAGFTLAALLIFGIIQPETFIAEVAWFLGLTVFWAVVLWKPFKKIMRSSKRGYSNIIGSEACTLDTLEKGKIGTVMWSGTIMRSKIIETSRTTTIAKDTQVWVHDKKGTVLLVDNKPKNV